MTSTAAPPPTVEFAPRLSTDAAEAVARDAWQLDGRATELPSDRDQNFLIDDRAGRRLVLKIANSRERRDVLEAQQALLQHLSTRVDLAPRVIAAASGDTIVEIAAPDGSRHMAWALSLLEGRPMTELPYEPTALLEDLGARAAALRQALNGFDHPALHRDIQWDTAHGRELVRQRRPDIADAALGSAIDRAMAEYDRATAPHLDALPLATIHGDLNSHNILIDDSAGDDGAWRVGGIVDYGDAVHSFAVADLAIAIAYALLGAADPLAAACAVVRGYVRVGALDDEELAALYGLVVLRLAMSACIAAEQQRLRPDNAYLGVSQEAVARQLPALAAVPFALAEAAFRNAAGRSATRHGQRVLDFLRHHTSYEPILPYDLRREPALVLDLGVASPLIDGDPSRNAEPMLTARVEGVMRDAGVHVAVGQYDEPRLIYVAPAFALGPRPVDEHRTVHIGLDLFAAAGTPVFAPLAGIVHAFADNEARQDYGPVIVLRHATDDGVEFFTLYGHLSRESLRGLIVGRAVRAGERIATLGGAEVNGGWTPHLHLQIMVDALGLDTDFPGVAPPSQRALWRELCPDPNLIVGVPPSRFPARVSNVGETLDRRQERIGRNLSIAYREPVRVVRGWMQYLYDDEGRRYLDAYNNVPHVGHCHRRVVEAGAEQMRVLNTNTRYLNDLLAEYADRLTQTLPRPLDVCYFVSSASEANELALRLARAYTGARDVVVLEHAYHGNTTSLIDVSPYKHAGPGGVGAPDWVHVAPLADDYRGPFKRDDPRAGERYAAQAADVVREARGRGRSIAAFLAETCPSVGGQIVLPDGYLQNVYEHVRKAGAVCIADEVQTGLGRMGTSFWAFEDQGVVPDIVVMGKPLGNGHPIGAVATTRAIAEAFDNGMEYFSTFGGNTVSCAIGLAVLDVVRDEGLQAHAKRVGDRMLDGLRTLMARHEIIGDVRGSGLFLGVELVRDRGTLEPAGKEAAFVANRMRERRVLLGTDGPHHNVVKIRPPMPFALDDAWLLLEELELAVTMLGH